MSKASELTTLIEQADPADILPGMDMSQPPGEPLTDNILAAVRIMQRAPLLQAPAVAWLLAKEAELANAQLQVLYTPEQLAAMKEAAG